MTGSVCNPQSRSHWFRSRNIQKYRASFLPPRPLVQNPWFSSKLPNVRGDNCLSHAKIFYLQRTGAGKSFRARSLASKETVYWKNSKMFPGMIEWFCGQSDNNQTKTQSFCKQNLITILERSLAEKNVALHPQIKLDRDGVEFLERNTAILFESTAGEPTQNNIIVRNVFDFWNVPIPRGVGQKEFDFCDSSVLVVLQSIENLFRPQILFCINRGALEVIFVQIEHRCKLLQRGNWELCTEKTQKCSQGMIECLWEWLNVSVFVAESNLSLGATCKRIFPLKRKGSVKSPNHFQKKISPYQIVALWLIYIQWKSFRF